MFCKEEFKLKFDFLLRCYYEMNASTFFKHVEIEEYKLIASKVLWQTRFKKTAIQGIDNIEVFQSFCCLLSIGITQLDFKIIKLYKNDITEDFFFTQLNMLLIEAVNEISIDIQELLK